MVTCKLSGSQKQRSALSNARSHLADLLQDDLHDGLLNFSEEVLSCFGHTSGEILVADILFLCQKAERMRESLHFIGAPVRNSHTLFVEQDEAASISLDEHFDTPAELLGRTYNRPRRSQLSTAAAVTGLAEGAADTRKLDRCGLHSLSAAASMRLGLWLDTSIGTCSARFVALKWRVY